MLKHPSPEWRVVDLPAGPNRIVQLPDELDRIKDTHLLLNTSADEPLSPPVPYIIRRERPGQYAVSVGLDHAGDDLDHPNYGLLRAEWQQFVERTAGHPRLALYEGRKVEHVPETENGALTLGREAPLIAYWAQRDGVPSREGEPPRDATGSHLLDRFPPDHVYYFQLALQLSQYPRMHVETRPPLEEYLQQTYDSFYIPLRGWEHLAGGKGRLLEWLAATHKTLFNRQFDPMDAAFFTSQIADYTINPTQQSPIQKVAAEFNAYRDVYLIKTYTDCDAAGVSTFDARGWPHIYGLDKHIRALSQRSPNAKITANGPSLRAWKTAAILRRHELERGNLVGQ